MITGDIVVVRPNLPGISPGTALPAGPAGAPGTPGPPGPPGAPGKDGVTPDISETSIVSDSTADPSRLSRIVSDLTTSPSRAALIAGTIALRPQTTAVRTLGYYAAGDGGGALYARRSAEPAHPGKFIASGSWWEIVPDERGIDIRQTGAKALTSLVTPIDTTNAAINTAAIRNAAAVAEAFGYIPIRIRGQYAHDDELHFVGDHKVFGEGPTPHAYAVAQLTLTGPSALLYSGSGTQVTFENIAVLGSPTSRGWRFEGIELITINGSARAFHGTGISYGHAEIYAIGHDVAAEFDTTPYPGGALNGQSGGEDEYSAHNNVRIVAQSTKTILKLTGSTDPTKGNICKNNFWISGDYANFDAIVGGNSDSNDFKEVYLYKNATTYSRTISTTASSNVVTVNDASSLAVGMYVFSDDIPSGSTIQSISGTSLTLTRATGSANARKTKTGKYAGFSTAAGRGIVMQGGSAYGSAARSNLFSGVLEPGEGGVHVLGTEDYTVASQNHEIKADNFENNSFNAAQVRNIGAGASLTVSSTQGTRRWSDVALVPTSRNTAEWQVDGAKALGFEADGTISRPRTAAAVAYINTNLTPTADGTTRTAVVGQEARLNTRAAYNASTGAFTCPVDGTYRVKASLLVTPGSTGGALISGYILRNGTAIDGQDAFYQHQAGVWGTVSVDTLVSCLAGQTLSLAVTASAAVTISGAPGRYVSKVEFEHAF